MSVAAGRPPDAVQAESVFRFFFRSEPVKLDFVDRLAGRTALKAPARPPKSFPVDGRERSS